jgi:hypothetical protein
MHDVSSSLGKCSPEFYYFRTRNRLWFFTAFSPFACARTRLAVLRDVFLNSFYPELRGGNWRAAWAVVRGYIAGLLLPARLKQDGNRQAPAGCRPGS